MKYILDDKNKTAKKRKNGFFFQYVIMNWYMISKISSNIIKDPKFVGTGYMSIGHPDSKNAGSSHSSHQIWKWDGEEFFIVPANYKNTHGSLWWGSLEGNYAGRYDQKGKEKRVSIQTPYGASKDLPPALVFELESRFGEDINIYVY